MLRLERRLLTTGLGSLDDTAQKRGAWLASKPPSGDSFFAGLKNIALTGELGVGRLRTKDRPELLRFASVGLPHVVLLSKKVGESAAVKVLQHPGAVVLGIDLWSHGPRGESASKEVVVHQI